MEHEIIDLPGEALISLHEINASCSTTGTVQSEKFLQAILGDQDLTFHTNS